jgi:hypothetical protein
MSQELALRLELRSHLAVAVDTSGTDTKGRHNFGIRHLKQHQ